MIEDNVVGGELATARRLVDLLEDDGYQIDVAAWVIDEAGDGRLYLVPHDQGIAKLKETIRVAHTISAHKDELPGRHDLRYCVVEHTDPLIEAINSTRRTGSKLSGVFKDGTYIETAYVLRPAA
jgi:hypothetical protein